VQAGVLLTLFFAWNVSQAFEELDVKQSVVLRRHTHFYINNWGARFDDRAFRSAGLVVEMLFMLFSVYNTAKGHSNLISWFPSTPASFFPSPENSIIP